MKTRLPWILLAVSVAFSVFFAIGYIRAKHDAERVRTVRERVERVARQLEFDDRQLKALRKLLDELAELRKTIAPQRDAFLAEITKDQPDEKVLQDFITSDSVKEYRLARLALIRKFVGLMRPQQREKWVQRIKKRGSPSK